jgi:hypothetical protein
MNRISFSPGQPHTKRRWPSRRLELELLEARNLLSVTNVLVNDPTEDTIPTQDTQSETAIVLGANSKIVVAYNDDGAFSYPNPLNPTSAGYSLSTDAGTSFKDKGQFPSSGPYWAYADPVLARSSNTGTILMSINSNNLNTVNTPAGGVGESPLIYRSSNNGATFSTPIIGAPGFVPGVDIADKPWMAVDNYPGPGYGNAYLAWTDFDTSLSPKDIFFTRSTDDGQDWGPSGGLTIHAPKLFGGNSNSFTGTFVTVGPDHAVYVFWWDNTQHASILMRKSTDQGQTFGGPVTVAGLNTHTFNGDLGLTESAGRTFRSNGFPQAAVNPVTGDIYVVFDDKGHGSQDKADVYFTMSTDGGKTWSKSIRVNDDNTYNDQWQPAIAVTPDGSHVGIFWYDRRLDPANNLIDRFGVIGTVSGHAVNFAPNFRITDVSFPPAFGQDPAVSSAYMGDYDQATADNSYFYTTWGDNRLGDSYFANQPDVRFAQIPVGADDAANSALALSASIVSATSMAGLSHAGSLNESASLLVGLLNPVMVTGPALPSPAPPVIPSGATTDALFVPPPAEPTDSGAGQFPGSSLGQPSPATGMEALDFVFAGAGAGGLSDGQTVALGVKAGGMDIAP